MATGPITQVSDVIVPEIFTPYIQQFTEEKARIIQSGVAVRDPAIDTMLAGGGLTFNVPSFRDLDNDTDRVSTDTHGGAGRYATAGTAAPDPFKIETDQEIAVRLNRNNSWSSSDLASVLAGTDPLKAIGDRVGFYWVRRLQALTIATVNGVIKDNVANDAGDYENDISGAAFIDGVTNFSAEAFLDAAVTMGDSMEDLVAIMVHSVVYNRMQKNNLIDFIPDSDGKVVIPTFLGRQVLIDDGMPNTTNVYDSWLFGSGFLRFGSNAPKVPTEVVREAGAGNGGGQEVLYSRQQWSMHPVGHAFTGTAANGGPGNGAGANDLNNAGSWNRVYPERKMIKFARLVTREA